MRARLGIDSRTLRLPALVVLPLIACSGSASVAKPVDGGAVSDAPSGVGGAGSAGNGGAAQAGQSGQAGTGGAAGTTVPTGGAGSGGTSSAGSGGTSEGLACFHYIEAVCNRRAQCRGTEDAFCLNAAWACPQTYFLPGSTRTPEKLEACAKDWATFDCDRLLRGDFPSCVSPGTLGPGESCQNPSQCASLVCRTLTCSTPAPAGGACSDTVTCPPGQSCAGGICAPSDLPTPDTGNGPAGGAGETCVWNANCRTGLYCAFVAATPGTGRCALPPTTGSPCGDTQGLGATLPARSACDEASYCGMDEMCHVLPPLGSPCGETRYNGLLLCAQGAYCETDTLTCKPARNLGESCQESTVFVNGKPTPEQCDPSVGARCICVEAGAQHCAGKPGTCLVPVTPGDACGFAWASCLYGSTCLNGICNYP